MTAGSCPTPWRVDHRTRAAAEVVAKRVNRRRHRNVAGYWCVCGSWHVGPAAEVAQQQQAATS